MKVILMTAMHGRHQTVKRAFEKTAPIHKVVVCSTQEDYDFLEQFDDVDQFMYPNEPLSDKWNFGISLLEHYDFDYVILAGSDDYFDQNFVNYILNCSTYDMIGFTDMYFEDKNGDMYYWPGYERDNIFRFGEPAGAGKTYSKEYLKRIDWNLFPKSRNYSLDGMSWARVHQTKALRFITSLKKNNLMMCDIKDGEGLTDLSRIKNLVKI